MIYGQTEEDKNISKSPTVPVQMTTSREGMGLVFNGLGTRYIRTGLLNNPDLMLKFMHEMPYHFHKGYTHKEIENCFIHIYLKLDKRARKYVIFFYVLNTTIKDSPVGYVGIHHTPYRFCSFDLKEKPICDGGKIRIDLDIQYHDGGECGFFDGSKTLVLEGIQWMEKAGKKQKGGQK